MLVHQGDRNQKRQARAYLLLRATCEFPQKYGIAAKRTVPIEEFGTEVFLISWGKPPALRLLTPASPLPSCPLPGSKSGVGRGGGVGLEMDKNWLVWA